MGLLDVLAIAVGLAMDAFAVAVVAGAAGHVHRLRPAVRLAFHLGLFQFLMPVIGWYAGSRAVTVVAAVDHWIAFGLLALVGGRMLRSGLAGGGNHPRVDASRGWTMVTVCVATSIDAFAVGLSLAMIGVRILYPSLVIGLVTAGLSFAGARFGDRAGARFGPVAEVVGGLILVAIGVRVLVVHLAG